jgi:methylated-DNA-protein-cysteine methyltransferase-like protein
VIAKAIPEKTDTPMASKGSTAFARIRAEVIRVVAAIPEGRFTTYGSIAGHLNVNPRHVAYFLARLGEEEAAILPWHRVVAAEARISRGMAEDLRAEQQARLEAEGMKIDPKGFIIDPDQHFHVVGPKREIRWDVE